MSEIQLVNDKNSLFDFWYEIPVVLEITDQEKYATEKSEIRNQIVGILTAGIEDIHPKTKTKQYRHGLTANEIFKIVKQSLPKEKVKLPNIYFHLKELEKINMVQIIATMQKGQRFTTFYGRTSRMTIIKNDSSQPKKSAFNNNNFITLIQKFSPQLDTNEIEKMLSSLERIEHVITPEFGKWVEENSKILRDITIENQALYNVFQVIFRYNEDVYFSLQRLAEILHIETTKEL